MFDEKFGLFVAVFSSGRPGNVERQQKIIGENVTWIVGNGEEPDYRRAGALHVVEGGGLCESRNLALRMAWEQELTCLEMSDDLHRLKECVADEHGTVEAYPIMYDDAVRAMQAELAASRVNLAGVAPTANKFYYSPTKRTSSLAFVVGDFIMVKPSKLFFDENLKLKEDYDYTLQHIQRYGSICRLNYLLVEFSHRTNKGGAVAVRTPALEQKMIAYLKGKWPGYIRDNPRRANEILLKFPR